MKQFAEKTIDEILRAMRASDFEFATLIPRLTPEYRKNAEACRTLLQSAISKLMKEGE